MPERTEATPLGASIPYERFLDCVHCGLCTSACPTYLETGDENDSPRGRIYLMRAVRDGRLALTDEVAGHLDLCLDCRSCETACPSGVQYGRLIEPFRAEMHRGATAQLADTPQPDAADDRPDVTAAASPSWFQRRILFGLFPHKDKLGRSLRLARWAQRFRIDRLAEWVGVTRLLPETLQRMQRLLPPLESPPPPLPELLPAQGTRRARVGLFLGCVADAMFRSTHWATARVLQANGCEVVIPKLQTCCGAIHYHAGSGEPALRLAEQNADAFAKDLDAVIVNVAGCGSMLKDYRHIAEELAPRQEWLHRSLGRLAGQIRDVTEFLDDLGPVRPQGRVPLVATYHDACHLCHAQQIRQAPRNLLGLIDGLELRSLPESEICCGAAGSYNLTQPEMADRLGRRKAENILKTGAQAVITANAGCSLQIQAVLRQVGRPLPVYHPMDLLARAYGETLPTT